MASVLGKANRLSEHGRKWALEKGTWEGVERWNGAGKCVDAWCTKALESGTVSGRYVKVVR